LSLLTPTPPLPRLRSPQAPGSRGCSDPTSSSRSYARAAPWTTFGCTSAESASVACECRRSCSRIGGSFAAHSLLGTRSSPAMGLQEGATAALLTLRQIRPAYCLSPLVRCAPVD
jgi:hypothetical protein